VIGTRGEKMKRPESGNNWKAGTIKKNQNNRKLEGQEKPYDRSGHCAKIYIGATILSA
jgi:hypothetical protein